MKNTICDECKVENGIYNNAKILIVEDTPMYSDPDVTIAEITKKAHYNGFRKSDYVFCTAVQCLNSTLKKKEINTCAERLDAIIEQVDPKVIILVNSEKSIGIKSMFGHIVKFPSIMSIHGLKIPYKNRWVLPVLSPIVGRNKNMESVIHRDLMNAFKFCKSIPEITKIPIYKNTCILTDYNLCVAVLISLISKLERTGEVSAFDYETTGLNSKVKGHKILSVSIAVKNSKGNIISYAFPIHYPRVFTKNQLTHIKNLLKKYLTSKKIFKTAHNSTFEKTWSNDILKVTPSNIVQCTQVTQHILDVRPKTKSLKIQALLRYGIDDYAKSSRKFIEADSTGFNKMDKMPLEELLLYNGIDSLITLQLYFDQQKELIDRGMEYSNMFYTEGMHLLQKISNNGICVDIEYFRAESGKLQKEIQELTGKIMSSKEVVDFLTWKKDTEVSKKKKPKDLEFNFGSTKQLREFFFKFLGFKSKKFTKTMQDSVDVEVLTNIDHWIADALMIIRKKQKIDGTYLSQFINCEVNGKVHPSFSLSTARSLRSSSFEPNMQNIPKRVEEISNLIRKGIRPSLGNRLIEIDFSGAEVICSAAYHKDPAFINYLLDKNTDMHRDLAMDIFILPQSEITKEIRFYGKNMFTFAQFYGDYYRNCAKNLWNIINIKTVSGVTVKDHLAKKGIKTLEQFENHLQKVEDRMWNVRFKTYTEWKKSINDEYLNTGIVNTFLGFQYTGYLDKKQTTNYQVQGTSFHLLLYVLILMQEWIEENNLKTKIISEVHDSGVFDSPVNEYRAVVKQFMIFTADLKNEFPWLPLPMSAEAEISEVNGNLAEMTKFEILYDIEE